MARTVVISLVCVLPALVACYPYGAPPETCLNMTPNHNVTDQNSTAPYSVSVSDTDIKQGTTVQVTITATAEDGYFEGFLIQARARGTTNIINGQFAKINASDTIQTMDCPGGSKNAMTHTDHVHMTKLVFSWTAPADLDVGQDVEFVCTFVKGLTTWWKDVKSEKITTSAAPSCPPALTSILVSMVTVLVLAPICA